MAVTEPDVQKVFDAAGAAADPVSSRTALVKGLTPLFNQGGGDYAPKEHTHPISDITGLQAELDSREPGLTYTQSAAATIWGPITHTFGRRANVYVMDSTGRQTFGEVIEANIGSVIIKFANPKSGSARLS